MLFDLNWLLFFGSFTPVHAYKGFTEPAKPTSVVDYVAGCPKKRRTQQGFNVSFYELPLESLVGFNDNGHGGGMSSDFVYHGYKEQNGLIKTIDGVTNTTFWYVPNTSAPEVWSNSPVYGYDVTNSNFTSVYEGYYYAEQSGTYTFNLTADDQLSLQLGRGRSCCGDFATDIATSKLVSTTNGIRFQDRSQIMTLRANSYTVHLEKGSYYPLRLVYFNTVGSNILLFKVTSPDRTTTDDFKNVWQVDSNTSCPDIVTIPWTGSYVTEITGTSTGTDGRDTIEVLTPGRTTTTTTTPWTGTYTSTFSTTSGIESVLGGSKLIVTDWVETPAPHTSSTPLPSSSSSSSDPAPSSSSSSSAPAPSSSSSSSAPAPSSSSSSSAPAPSSSSSSSAPAPSSSSSSSAPAPSSSSSSSAPVPSSSSTSTPSSNSSSFAPAPSSNSSSSAQVPSGSSSTSTDFTSSIYSSSGASSSVSRVNSTSAPSSSPSSSSIHSNTNSSSAYSPPYPSTSASDYRSDSSSISTLPSSTFTISTNTSTEAHSTLHSNKPSSASSIRDMSTTPSKWSNASSTETPASTFSSSKISRDTNSVTGIKSESSRSNSTSSKSSFSGVSSESSSLSSGSNNIPYYSRTMYSNTSTPTATTYSSESNIPDTTRGRESNSLSNTQTLTSTKTTSGTSNEPNMAASSNSHDSSRKTYYSNTLSAPTIDRSGTQYSDSASSTMAPSSSVSEGQFESTTVLTSIRTSTAVVTKSAGMISTVTTEETFVTTEPCMTTPESLSHSLSNPKSGEVTGPSYSVPSSNSAETFSSSVTKNSAIVTAASGITSKTSNSNVGIKTPKASTDSSMYTNGNIAHTQTPAFSGSSSVAPVESLSTTSGSSRNFRSKGSTSTGVPETSSTSSTISTNQNPLPAEFSSASAPLPNKSSRNNLGISAVIAGILILLP